MKCRADWIQNQFSIVEPTFSMGIAIFSIVLQRQRLYHAKKKLCLSLYKCIYLYYFSLPFPDKLAETILYVSILFGW